MHFPIIELKDKRVPKDERMSECELYDDSCVGYFTDYVGDEYTDEERHDYFQGGRLQKLLKGIATVDTRDFGSITFLDADTIRDTIKKEMLDIAAAIQDKILKDERVRPDDVKYEAEFWRGFDDLFHFEGRVCTSGNLISDAVWYAGKTLYIGAIFDAHI